MFQEEVWAINGELTWLETIKEPVLKTTICVDSQTALKAFCNNYHISPMVIDNQVKVKKDTKLQ